MVTFIAKIPNLDPAGWAPRGGGAEFAKALQRAQGRAAESVAVSSGGGDCGDFGENFTGP
jgi:hypothetical protein